MVRGWGGGGGQRGRGVGGFGLIEERKNFNRYVVVQFYPCTHCDL